VVSELVELPEPLRDVMARYIDHLTVERGAARSTVRSYHRDLRRYGEFLVDAGIGALGEVGASDLAEFQAELVGGTDQHRALARSSVARAMVAVRRLHQFARAEGLVDRDAAREVVPPSLPQRLPRALTVPEVSSLLEVIAGERPGDLRDRALVELLYSSGARISEAIGLDVDDLDV